MPRKNLAEQAESYPFSQEGGVCINPGSPLLSEIAYVGVSGMSVEIHFTDGSGLRVEADGRDDLSVRVLNHA